MVATGWIWLALLVLGGLLYAGSFLLRPAGWPGAALPDYARLAGLSLLGLGLALGLWRLARLQR